MIILALDTTSRAGSVAVLRSGAVVYDAAGDPAITHGQRLPADLMRAMDAAGIGIAEVDLFAVAAGPGSFTGLRVGIATIQGLAMAHARRVVAVSVLDALARSGGGRAAHVGAWVSAQRGQVFAALYDGAGSALLAPATAMTPQETITAWQPVAAPGNVFFIGDGAVEYAAEIERAGGGPISPAPRLAPVIGHIAAAAPDTAVRPHAVVPIYVRRPDAELARDRRGGA